MLRLSLSFSASYIRISPCLFRVVVSRAASHDLRVAPSWLLMTAGAVSLFYLPYSYIIFSGTLSCVAAHTVIPLSLSSKTRKTSPIVKNIYEIIIATRIERDPAITPLFSIGIGDTVLLRARALRRGKSRPKWDSLLGSDQRTTTTTIP